VRRICVAFLLAALGAGVGLPGAAAADFRSVQENAAVLYDAPSRQATPLFVVSRSYPLEVIVNLEAWVKVRDHAGALTWIEKKSLGDKRMVLVTAPSAEARQRPEDAAATVFSAAQNVALELVEIAPNGWLRVRHGDGATGFVRAAAVWGY
jgi:SH3-like domain-containing protein